MAAVTTERLMDIALDMAGYSEIPADSGIYYSGTRISHVLVGIDVGPAEVFMARQLGYHVVLAHRPPGYPGPVWEVYHRHVAQMEEYGVPHTVAQEAIASRYARLEAAALLHNYERVPSVARLLEMPLLNILSPLETIGRHLLKRIVDEATAANPSTSLAELTTVLGALPELRSAPTAPQLMVGDWSQPVGVAAISHGAYLPPDWAIARAYLAHGIDTLICAGIDGSEIQQLSEGTLDRGAILALGSSAMASIGLNPYISRLRAEGLEVTSFSGVIEISH